MERKIIVLLPQNDIEKIAACIETKLKNGTYGNESGFDCAQYKIKQFEGTAFQSDYMCFFVEDSETDVKCVVKLTNDTEYYLLPLLSLNRVNIISWFAVRSIRFKREKRRLIFENYISGKELYMSSSREAWEETAEVLATIHTRYWKGNNREELSKWLDAVKSGEVVSRRCVYENKIKEAYGRVSHSKALSDTWKKSIDYIKTMPVTLCHGDMFPTNVIISGDIPYFIDWADAAELPYTADIVRLTCLVKLDGGNMCPCVDDVLREYFKGIQNTAQRTYEEFLKDVYTLQFIELANYYTPPNGLYAHSMSYQNQFNLTIESKLYNVHMRLQRMK